MELCKVVGSAEDGVDGDHADGLAEALPVGAAELLNLAGLVEGDERVLWE